MSTADNAPNSGREVWPVDVVEYSFGQLIVREGDVADCAFIIKSGEVEVLKRSPDGRDIHIARLGPQEIFGELCLFEEKSKRSASIRVSSDRAMIMVISKSNFEKQLAVLPEGLRHIIQIMASRLRKANHYIAILS